MSSNPVVKKPNNSNYIIFLVVVLVISAIAIINSTTATNVNRITLDQFIEEARGGSIAKISLETDNSRINITKVDGSQSYTFKEPAATLDQVLSNVPAEVRKDIETDIIPASNNGFWMNLLISVVPFLLIVGVFLFMMRSAQSSNSQAMSFGKSKARMFDNQKKATKFTDVAGAEEAKQELVEIVDFLRSPLKYTQMGAKIPKGVLLVGPPGTGKTLLARAVAGEAGVPFFSISGSEFVEMFVGVGASRVRDLFKKAQKNAPCIVFIDEIDAVGRQRGAGFGGGHDEREQTLNQILTEMDGFEGETGIIVMAATNRPDVLDPALLRPGRFDRRVMVDLPDIKDREAILNVHARNKPIEKDASITTIAQHTPGFSGADLENLMNEAAILAAKEDRKTITQLDLQNSVEKVMMGPERKSRVLNDAERKRTAYHEVGHAVVGHLRPGCDPIHKISIVSRGMALGVTWFLPEEDKHLYTRSKFFDEICSLMGGYCAEIEFFGEMSTGASNDLEKATGIANRMVTVYGMSALGPVQYRESNHEVFLGRDLGHVKNYSEETAKKIDQEVKIILDEAFETTKKIIAEQKPLITTIAEDLLVKESLTRDQFEAYFKKSANSTESTETELPANHGHKKRKSS